MFSSPRQLVTVTGFRSFSRKHGRISKGALERPLSTNQRKTSLPRPFRQPTEAGLILTLDPKKFVEKKQNRLHIGNLQSFTLHISPLEQSKPVRLIYDIQLKRRQPCPPDTKGFLYYSIPPEKPRIAGEIRLRVTSSDDPASFESGSDLLRSNGRPWSRPLYAISKYYSHLYEKLREDNSVPDDLDAVLSTLPSVHPIYCRRHILYTFNDTFILDFNNSRCLLTFLIITEQGMEKLQLRNMFYDSRRIFKSSYTGSALARFERSTLPEHDGTRTIVLRFLKIITPVKCFIPNYDGRICRPEEGELHRRILLDGGGDLEHRVWNVNIDMPKPLTININTPRGLQLLWDT